MKHPSRERCAVLIKTVKIIEHNYSKCESWRRSNRGPRPEQCTLYIFCNSLCILTLKKLKHVESRGGKIALEYTVIVWYEKDGENCGEVLVKQTLKAAVKSVKHRPRTEWSRSTFTHMYICGKRKRRKLFFFKACASERERLLKNGKERGVWTHLVYLFVASWWRRRRRWRIICQAFYLLRSIPHRQTRVIIPPSLNLWNVMFCKNFSKWPPNTSFPIHSHLTLPSFRCLLLWRGRWGGWGRGGGRVAVGEWRAVWGALLMTSR